MNGTDDWPILTLLNRMASLFVAGVAVIALLLAAEFLQARSHVTKVERPRVIRTIDTDTVVTAYTDKGQTPPSIVLHTVSRYTFRAAWEGIEPPIFYPCPHESQNWAVFLEGINLIEAWLEKDGPSPELLEARQLINVVAGKFPSGEPSAACAITLALATTGALNEEELSVAADILRLSEHITVSVSVRNDSNADAEEVTVIPKEEGFRCDDEEPDRPGQCKRVPLEIEAEETFVFRTEKPGLFPDKSDSELAEMFYPDWVQWEGPDQPRIWRLLGVVVLCTLVVPMIDLVIRLWKYRAKSWGRIAFPVMGVALFILTTVIIYMIRREGR